MGSAKFKYTLLVVRVQDCPRTSTPILWLDKLRFKNELVQFSRLGQSERKSFWCFKTTQQFCWLVLRRQTQLEQPGVSRRRGAGRNTLSLDTQLSDSRRAIYKS